MGFWKRQREAAEERERDIEKARAELVVATQERRSVQGRSSLVYGLAGRLAERRELNHFGDSLSISFTPRRNHA